VHVAWKAGTRAGSRKQAARTATMPTAAPALLPPLLRELWWLLAAHRPAVRQARCVDRLRARALGHLCTAARHTISQVLLALGLVAADWSAFHRLVSHARPGYAVLSACFLQEALAQMPEEEPYVAMVDGVQRPRASRTMPGTSWLKNPRTPVWKAGQPSGAAFRARGRAAAALTGLQPGAAAALGAHAVGSHFPPRRVLPRCQSDRSPPFKEVEVVSLTSPLAGPRFASTRQRRCVTASPRLACRRLLVSCTDGRASPGTCSGRRCRGRTTPQLLQQDKQLARIARDAGGRRVQRLQRMAAQCAVQAPAPGPWLSPAWPPCGSVR
jgi:hypothetical protein